VPNLEFVLFFARKYNLFVAVAASRDLRASDLQTTPTQAELLARLDEEMSRPPFHQILRPQAESVDAQTGAVTIKLVYRPELGRSPHDAGFHGGVIASLIDVVAHAVVAVRIGRMAPTLNLRVDFLRVATGDLRAVGKIIKIGRTIALADAEVTDADSRLIAIGRGTFSTLVSVR
jgi:uncharacterized protein (TIGR00369 family)